MNTNNSNLEKLITIVLSIIVIGVLIKLFKGLADNTKTEIISDKGMEALNDPATKQKIDEAFEKSVENQKLTGVWENPELDLR
jgi:hypothetical protein